MRRANLTPDSALVPSVERKLRGTKTKELQQGGRESERERESGKGQSVMITSLIPALLSLIIHTQRHHAANINTKQKIITRDCLLGCLQSHYKQTLEHSNDARPYPASYNGCVYDTCRCGFMCDTCMFVCVCDTCMCV